MSTEGLLQQVRDELARLRTSLEANMARVEERCVHRASTLDRHEKALDEYFTRLRNVEQQDAKQTESLKRLEASTEANAKAIADLTVNTGTLKNILDGLIITSSDRETRLRELEQYRWWMIGAVATGVAGIQLVIKYLLP